MSRTIRTALIASALIAPLLLAQPPLRATTLRGTFGAFPGSVAARRAEFL